MKYGLCYRKIKEKLYTEYQAFISLELQRFRCNNCYTIFSDTCTIINKNENISKHLKWLILEELKLDESLSNIAAKFNISTQTVFNIFEANVNINRHKLPEVLCIDEFKNLETEDGKYAVLLYDPVNQTIIDIIDDRRMEKLDEYFYDIPINELNNVKYFISDMYEPYRVIKNKFFKNATHVVDGFHFSRYVTKALNDIRIRVMNSFERNTPEYRTLKKYWHIYLKRLKDLKEYSQYNPMRKEKTSTSQIITDSLEIDTDFYTAFLLKEEYMNMEDSIHFETKNQTLNNLIHKFRSSGLQEFDTVANTFENWFDEIGNSYIRFGDNRLNNGHIEGMNNRIKEIKRVFFGCSKFYYLRNRLMYIINNNEPLTNVDVKSIPRKKRN